MHSNQNAHIQNRNLDCLEGRKNRPARLADLEKVSQLLKNIVTSLEYYNILAKETEMKKNTLGKLLLENFETSKKRGSHKIWCDSRSTNEPSKNLLRKVGFRENVEIKDHWYKQDFIFWQRYL